MLYTTKIPSPAGKITLASDGIHLIGLWFDGQQYFAHTIKEETKENPGLFIFTQTRDWLDRYFSGRQPAVRELSLRPDGSVFRREVWKLLCEIPYGEVTTYGAIARKIAAGRGQEKMSAQAVGGAIGHNPISIIIPCHRVIGSDGSLTGYGGGLELKQKLLTFEKQTAEEPVNYADVLGT